MRATIDWIENGPKEYPTSGAFIDAIKLDAMREGMRRAAKVAHDKAIYLDNCGCMIARQAILSAAEQLTEKDL